LSPDLRLVHLYPDLLRTYGDRGNLVALVRRAEWRGFSVHVQGVGRGDETPPADLFLLGGGTDRVQSALGDDLAARREALVERVREGAILVGICGGYQLLGHRYVTTGGVAVPGLGLLDAETRAGSPRIIGRVRATAALWGSRFDLVGFENHGGRTLLGPAAAPLASVRKRRGNNGRDRTEGAVQGTLVGTYLHGPVLPLNPELADALLARALSRVTAGASLEPLDDRLEHWARRLRRRLRR